MTFFLIVAVLLVLLPGVLVFLWARRAGAAAFDRDALNVALFRERRVELDADLAAGRIDDALHASLLAELEALLVSDVEARGGTAAPHRSRLLLAVPLLVPALVLPLYLATGYSPEVRDWLRLEGSVVDIATLKPPVDEPSRAALADAARVLQSQMPRDAAGADAWMTLAAIWADAGMIELAKQSLQEVVRLVPGHREATLALARLEIALADGQLPDPARELLDGLLAADPNDSGALLSYALAAFTAGDYDAAIRHFTQLRTMLPPGEEEARRMIDEGLAAARARQAGAVAGGQAVAVRLAPGVEAGSAAALFVIVRAADGPPMPLAVRKLPPVLPAEVTITDADMLMGGTLPLAGPVQVVARLSRTGDATPASGDLESAPVTLSRIGERPVTLELAQQRP
jgi:cytochrome c-type biogenesis protein CcmH